jgi:hypothetical protein
LGGGDVVESTLEVVEPTVVVEVVEDGLTSVTDVNKDVGVT